MLFLLLLAACGSTWDDRDEDGDGYSIAAGDCWDTDPTINPGTPEACDGADQDCDGEIDEGTLGTWYADADGDGFGDEASPTIACEQPAGTVTDTTDCDDAAVGTFPGAEELCDGIDTDCDGDADGGAGDVATWYADADADGYGDAATSTTACEQPDGYVSDATDCDDTDGAYHPGAAEDDCTDLNDYNCDGSVAYEDGDGDGWFACEECDDGDPDVRPDASEVCNDLDDDCDAEVDEDDAIDASTWYADTDTDGYGDAAEAWQSCEQPGGYVADATDCDDTTLAVNPSAEEVCNLLDDDCDGDVDEDDAIDASTWYADADADGYGEVGSTTVACEVPAGYTDDTTDCDDTDAAVHPDADEVCDGAVDDDCDGDIDEDAAIDASTWYADADGDTFGALASTTVACEVPDGYTADATDCDDTEDTIFPGADEECNGDDDDCDGTTDEDDAIDADTWYADDDGDAYGDPDVSTQACARPSGYVPNGTDCDDTESDVNPGGTEVCNGEDDDCDTTVDADATDADTWYADDDGDGFGDASATVEDCDQPSGYVADATDCDDTEADRYPGNPEVCDSLDNDCDTTVDESATDADTWYADDDGDGFGDASATVEDCDQPSGYVADATDCDDTEAAAYTGATEVCDSVDNDCDGATDPDWFSSDFASSVAAELSINGDAYQSGGALYLTDAAGYEAGTAILLERIPGDSWNVYFEFVITGGDGTGGADGLTFFFLDETDTTLVGPEGGSLGVEGYAGYAIEIDTYDNGSDDPDADHVALMDVASWTYLAESSLSEVQSGATHTLEIEMDNGAVRAWVDGTLEIDTTISGYAYDDVLVGWSGGTGGLDNTHAIDDAVIGCP